MANIFKIAGDFIKNDIQIKAIEIKNKGKLKKNYIIEDYRICNFSTDDVYVPAYKSEEEHKFYFLSKRPIEANFILVDKYQNLFVMKKPSSEVNKLFGDEEKIVTTVSDYDSYIPNNPIRNAFLQNATINQQLQGLNHLQNNGTLVLTIEQKATIEQTITVNQLIETVEDEAKYRFKPINNQDSLFSLLKDILKGVKSINDLEDKVIKAVIDQATGLLKDAIDMLIKKIKAKVNENGFYKE